MVTLGIQEEISFIVSVIPVNLLVDSMKVSTL